jgi:hypothetical protein
LLQYFGAVLGHVKFRRAGAVWLEPVPKGQREFRLTVSRMFCAAVAVGLLPVPQNCGAAAQRRWNDSAMLQTILARTFQWVHSKAAICFLEDRRQGAGL